MSGQAQMPLLVILAIALVGAPVLGWLGTAAVCNLRFLRTSNICGHNAHLTFVLLAPLIFFAIVYVLAVRGAKKQP